MTTLKTVSMYLRAAKTEAEDAGETTEGMASSISELREEILALTGNKVDIQIDEDTFKSTYQILQELSTVWGDLSDISQANLLELLAGKRNSNAVSAILENFQVAEDALTTSANSAGSALKENEQVLESIQGKINIFKAVFQDLSKNLISSDIIKVVVEFGTWIIGTLNLCTKLIDAFGGVKTILLTVASTLMIAKAEWIAHMAAVIKNFVVNKLTNGFHGLVSALRAVITAIPKAIAAWKAYAAGASSANAAVQASIPGIGLVLAGISTLITVLSLCSDSIENNTKDIATLESEMTGLSDSVKSISSDFRSMHESMTDIIPRFVELTRGVNRFGENVRLTDDEYAEFLSLNNKIAEMFPEIDMGMDRNGNSMLSLSYSATTLSDSLDDLVDAQRDLANQKIADSMSDYLNTIVKISSAYNNQIQSLRRSKTDLKDAFESVSNLKNGTVEIFNVADSEALNKRIKQLRKLGVEVTKTLRNTPSNATKSATFELAYKFDYDQVLRNYENALAGIDKEINNINAKKALKWKQINPIVSAWLQTDFRYADLGTKMQDIARNMIAGIDFSALGLTTEEDVKKYIEDYIILPLFNSSEEVKNAFGEVLSQLHNGEISPKEYEELMNDIFDALIKGIDPSKVATFKKLFTDAFGVVDTEGDTLNPLLRLAEEAKANSDKSFSDIFAKNLNVVDSEFKSATEGLISEWGGLSNTTEQYTKSLSSTLSQLSTLSDRFSKLGGSLSEFRESGYVSAKTLKELQEEFADVSGIDEYIHKIGNATNIDELESSLKSLAQQYVDTSQSLENINSNDKELITTQLEKLGVINALEVVNARLMQQYVEMTFQTTNISDLTSKQADSLYEVAKSAGMASDQLEKYAQIADKIAEIEVLNNKIAKTREQGGSSSAVGQAIRQWQSEIAELQKEVDKLYKPEVLFDPDKWITDKSNSGSKETELYVAELDRLYKLKEKLANIQEKINDLEHQFNISDDKKEQINLLKQEIEYYKEEQDVLEEINKQRDALIKDNIKKLQSAGFSVDYNSANDTILINNMEHLNKIVGSTTEETNEMRKMYEELINATIDLNSENVEAANNWQELSESIIEAKESIIEAIKETVTEADSSLSDVINTYNSLKDAAESYQKNGFLTVETFQSILSLGTEYLSYLYDESGAIKFNEENLERLIEAKIDNLAITQAMALVDMVNEYKDDAEALQELADASYEANDATWGLVYSKLALAGLDPDLYSVFAHQIEMIKDLAEAAKDGVGESTEALSEYYDKTSSALDYILNKTQELIKYEAEQQVKALEDQIEAYKKIIDLKKESLQAAKEEDDYEENVAEQVKKIAELQAQIDLLSLDNSQSQAVQNELNSLYEQLNEEQKTLAELQADYAYNQQIEALEKEAEAFEEAKNSEIEIIEESVSSQEKIYQLAIERIGDYWDTLYADLISWNTEAGNTINSEITSEWEKAAEAVKKYGSYLAALEAIDAYNQLTGSNGNTSIGQEIGNTIATVPDNSVESTMFGDVDGDGKVSMSDITTLAKAFANLITLSQSQLTVADVNQDGSVNMDDIITLQKYLANLINSPIIGEAFDISKSILSGDSSKNSAALVDLGQYRIVDTQTAASIILGEQGASSFMAKLSQGLLSPSPLAYPNLMTLSQHDTTALSKSHPSLHIDTVSVEVPITVSQKLDRDEIMDKAKLIGEVASDYIHSSLNRKGVSFMKHTPLTI